MRLLSVFFIFVSINIFSQIVYKTPSGTKYHLSDCRMVKNVSTSLSMNDALKRGLSPCKICNPPFNSPMGIVGKPISTPGTTSATQCHGITKKGKRCSRNTRIGNEYCFQHLPK